VHASLDVMEADSTLIRGGKPLVFTNCLTREGITGVVDLMGAFTVMANVIVVTPPPAMRAISEQVIPGFDEDSQCVARQPPAP
jgi:hypothetical protein